MIRPAKYVVFIFCFLSLFIGAHAEDPVKKKTICLNMIVKNESKVITRCLQSVKPLIDYWVIVDTGSTDGTQTIIKNFMKGIPGELHEQPWKNFGHNRNEALKLAKGKADYVLFIDADEVMALDPDFKLPHLDKDFYYIVTDYNGNTYCRIQLINNALDWKWSGVLHETVDAPNLKSAATLAGIRDVVNTDGFRSTDPQKYQKDAKILEEALKDDPNNTRNVFYLAQSYRDAQDYEPALKNYQKRIAMGGWDQEVFWAMFQAAILQENLKMPPETIIDGYYKAYHFRPSRAEPLYRLATYYRQQGNYPAAYLTTSTALKIPLPKDILFVENWVYDFGLLFEHSIDSYWVGRYDESQQASHALLNNPKLPANLREQVEKNIAFANAKVIEMNKYKAPQQEANAEKAKAEAEKSEKSTETAKAA